MYADDMSLCYPYCHEAILIGQIEHDASIIYEFARLSGLVLNSDKTPHCNGIEVFNAFICGRTVTESNSIKYLGLYFQSNLVWNTHLQYIRTKLVYFINSKTNLMHKRRFYYLMPLCIAIIIIYQWYTVIKKYRF